jgi:ketosteroid isomerase-like protein
MSQENVDVVRRAIDAFLRRDLDATVQDADRDVIVDWSRSPGVQAGIYRGIDATRDFWSAFLEVFDRMTFVPDEFIERGEYVVVPNLTRLWGRGGVEVEARSAYVVRLRGGHIVEWTLYRERSEALNAVGLED